mmetsp:Transcript_15425/g.38302  ORF Transcript_15425/g.38302 Transcript_15425/m.38302 type:complete len:1060 (+) Transcript_15425:21-3200(+)
MVGEQSPLLPTTEYSGTPRAGNVNLENNGHHGGGGGGHKTYHPVDEDDNNHEEENIRNEIRTLTNRDINSGNGDSNMKLTFRTRNRNLGSLDFERVVNSYSIQAKLDRMETTTTSSSHQQQQQTPLPPPLPPSSSISSSSSSSPPSSPPPPAPPDSQDIERKRRRRKHIIDSRSTTRWVLTILCAMLSGLTTVIVVGCTETIVAWRTKALDTVIVSDEYPVAIDFLFYISVSWIMSLAACLLCLVVSPEAVGSGIPEVIAYLNGVRVKKFNNRNLLLVKIIGSVLSVSSSLAVGMEGPLVLIGGIVGASLSNIGSFVSWLLTNNIFGCTQYDWPWLTRLWIWSTSDLSYFANDMERRNLVTIGAACGFAASFGAPIGGLLFVLDDISSFVDQSMMLRVLVANAIATFCLALYRGDLSAYGAIQFGYYNESYTNIFVDRFEEIPFWILLGIGGGILGGYFCKTFYTIKKWSGRKFNTTALHLLRTSYITWATCIVMFFLPMMRWTCHDIVDSGEDEMSTDDLLQGITTVSRTTGEVVRGRRFFCDADQVNEMATIMFGSRNKAIVRILSNPNEFYPLTLLLVGIVFFVLMSFTNTISIPSGMFTPTVLSGASLGAAVGIVLKRHVDEEINPSTFALLGVAALMAGVQRSTVSTCVILVEGTGQIRILLPVIIVVVIANYTAYLIHKDGIYDVLMIRLKSYPYLEHSDAYIEKYDVVQVKEVMNGPAITVREYERASSLVSLLRKYRHNGFPVVDKLGRFKGLVRRKQIVALIECGIFEKVGPHVDIDEDGALDPTSARYSPKPGVGSPSEASLMHLAYHIKDDRYESIQDLTDDDYDDNAFLLGIQKAVSNFVGRSTRQSAGKMSKTISKVKRTGTSVFLGAKALKRIQPEEREFNLAGDETLPRINPAALVEDDGSSEIFETALYPLSEVHNESDREEESLLVSQKKSSRRNSTSSLHSAPTGFAKIGQDDDGNVIISWLNPEHTSDVVNVAAVMNQGTYCVPENFPLSKAYKLFANLGLRWIIVIGGRSGGEVVGVLNRSGFLDLHIEKRTGIDFESE